MASLILRLAIIIGISYFALFILLFLFQKKLVYFPTKASFGDCESFKEYEKIDYNGTRFYYQANGKNVVVLYHGNAGSACDRYHYKNLLESANNSVVIVEYAGYSDDKRKPSMRLILKDVENVAVFINSRNFRNVTLVGESLGTGPASYHSTIQKTDKLLLISPFDSVAGIAQKEYWMFPVRLLLTENYDNIKWLKDFNGSIKVIHSKSDEITSISNARNLYSSLKAKDKSFVEIEGVYHNEMLESDQFRKEVRDFV